MNNSVLEKRVIQGGMGVAVSDFILARSVAKEGQLGVVSGTALPTVLTRRLQQGDSGGEIRSALSEFPNQDIVEQILIKYFVEGGKSPDRRFKGVRFPNMGTEGDIACLHESLEDLCVVSNFVEVTLAKRGHDNPVGINFLYKIEWPTLPSIYGAMLAGVDAILIGAGLPRSIPHVLDAFIRGEEAKMPLTVRNGNYFMRFQPNEKYGPLPAKRPVFLGIVSNHLGVKGLSNADGYIIEGHIAGGHNAPPRNRELTPEGEPSYGSKDEPNFDMIRSMIERNAKGQRFWLAGGYASRLKEAQEIGAQGVQVGTPFALSAESGIPAEYKQAIIEYIFRGGMVYTDPLASPSGFPFKTLDIEGSIGSEKGYRARQRRCDVGYLLDFKYENGEIVSCCPAEPVAQFVSKEKDEARTIGKKCLCNGLAATVGMGNPGEAPLFTLGADFSAVKAIIQENGRAYSARDVLRHILSQDNEGRS